MLRDNEQADASADLDAYVTQATPGGWWIGDVKVNSQVCWSLIRKCLLRMESWGRFNDEIVFWSMNEEAMKALDDPEYVPLILRHMAGEDVSSL